METNNDEIEKTLQSLDALERVEGNPFLFAKIQYRISQRNHRKTINPVWKTAGISFALILLFFNVLTVWNNLKPQNETNIMVELGNEFGINTGLSQLY
ncbi:hypothetical protein [Flectobacillus longus]|uniref:hypothetical protein n=1 Tax=Flectobacillus longus TaxID=2984207 RepID=UPI0024B6A1CB|nr:hypothetical protein [Flectobacillus longus]MDI9877991.1 hypothetical protein [Flectobacillus longus]